jgi:hypothetical protein
MDYFGDSAVGFGSPVDRKGRVSAPLVARSLISLDVNQVTFALSGLQYYDVLGELTTNQFTAASDGYYDVHLLIRTTAPAANTRDLFRVRFVYNSATTFLETDYFRQVSTFNQIDFNCSTTFKLSKDDTLDLFLIYQVVSGTGTTANLVASTASILKINKL